YLALAARFGLAARPHRGGSGSPARLIEQKSRPEARSLGRRTQSSRKSEKADHLLPIETVRKTAPSPAAPCKKAPVRTLRLIEIQALSNRLIKANLRACCVEFPRSR